MRLEKRDEPARGISGARRIERGADLRRMVRVIVDDERAAVIAEDLEPAIDAEELRQRGGGDVGVNAELAGHGDGREGVAHVVLAGHEELEEAAAFHFE